MNKLSPVEQRFVLHWGEMGTRWGINRTIAQIHALLYISPAPLNADDIVQTLGVARSNVSSSIRELLGWGVIRVAHVMGDKKDHFESLKDVWEMFRIVLDERKKREVDPTLSVLRECLNDLDSDDQADPQTRTKIKNLVDFFETTGRWYEQVRRWPTSALTKFLKLGDRALKTLKLGD